MIMPRIYSQGELRAMKKFGKIHGGMVLWCILCAWGLFCLIYGKVALDVQMDEWIFARGGDIVQHYLGWKFYRNSPWEFPIGMTNGTSFPHFTSVIYTDSIPIFAVLFKLLSPVLPKTFQYFGIYMLLSFFLQGLFAAIIVKKFTDRKALWMSSTILAIMSPVLLNRAFGHTALSGQFLILAAYALWLYRPSLGIRRELGGWFALGIFGVSIHMYFMPMIGLILLARVLEEVLDCHFTRAVINRSVSLVAGFIVVSLLTMFILGGFGKGFSGGSEGGLGGYNSNLNTLYNPLGKSSFLKDWPVLNRQYEGSGYLGAGALFLFIIAIFFFFFDTEFELKQIVKEKRNFIISALFLFLAIFSYATVFKIYFNDKRIIDITLPEIINRCLSIFRSSGRLIWVISYGCIIFSFYVLGRKGELGKALLIMCTIFQLLDIYPQYHIDFEKYNHQSSLANPFWKEAVEQYKHIVFINPYDYNGSVGRRAMYELAGVVSDYHMTLSKFRYARSFSETMREDMLEYIDELEQGLAREDTLYIFSKYYAWNQQYTNFNFYMVDDYIIGTCKKENLQPYSNITNSIDILFDENNTYVIDGENQQETLIIHGGGYSYGPYITLEPGKYVLTIEGEALMDAWVSGNPEALKLYNLKSSDKQLTYRFSLQSRLYDGEFYVGNIGAGRDVLVRSMHLEKID